MTTTAPSRPRRAVPRQGRGQRWLVAALAVVGAALLTFPFAAQWQQLWLQQSANETMAATVQQITPAERTAILTKAHQFNEALAAGVPASDFDYDSLLDPAGTGVMGRLVIESIDLDQSISHGTGDVALSAGLGHLPTSSLPVGGPSTHSIIGGHRGMATSTGFTWLPNVQPGDLVMVEVLGDWLAYRVTTLTTLPAEEAVQPPIRPGEDWLTLVTCDPIGINSHRILVDAVRVPLPAPAVDAVAPASTVPFPVWAVAFAAVLAGAVLYLWAPWRRTTTPTKETV